MRLSLLSICLALASCDLADRGDFLVGRECEPALTTTCDPGQACLPHEWLTVPRDFRCRDAASFDPIEGIDPPLAHCNQSMGFVCPGDLVCRADRVRARDSGALRRRVCQHSEDAFGPPEG